MRRERVYVAGPYSAKDHYGIITNVDIAQEAAAQIMLRGHLVHCPHGATYGVDAFVEELAGAGCYARSHANWMALDFSIIERWATKLFLIAPSPGADMEVKLAESIGIEVWRSLDDVPYAEGWDANKCSSEADCNCSSDSP